MQTGQLTLEEFLILLDAADTQLSNESALVIRQLMAELETAKHEAMNAIENGFVYLP